MVTQFQVQVGGYPIKLTGGYPVRGVQVGGSLSQVQMGGYPIPGVQVGGTLSQIQMGGTPFQVQVGRGVPPIQDWMG